MECERTKLRGAKGRVFDFPSAVERLHDSAMCGRFTLVRLAEFTDLFPWIRPPDAEAPPRYNIAPTQAIAVVTNQDEPKVEFFHWGLIPFWAKDASIGNRMINARAETLGEKSAFKKLISRRRCL